MIDKDLHTIPVVEGIVIRNAGIHTLESIWIVKGLTDYLLEFLKITQHPN